MDILIEYFPILFFIVSCVILLSGYPVSLCLGGVSLIFALIAIYMGIFPPTLLNFFPQRIFGIMTNQVLVAIPLFIFMGVMLERSKIAEELIDTMSSLFGTIQGGVAYSVVIVGMLLAASTGIVGATVVTMGLLSLPSMIKHHYSPSFSSGIVAASGTLGQIIPPSIILVLLGDVMSNANQEAQRTAGVLTGETISVGDLFSGALLPGLILVLCYLAYIFGVTLFSTKTIPREKKRKTSKTFSQTELLQALFPPLLLILAVLGSILAGVATPTEAAGLGALGASLIAILKFSELKRDPLCCKFLEGSGKTILVFLIILFLLFLIKKPFNVSYIFNFYIQLLSFCILLLSIFSFCLGFYRTLQVLIGKQRFLQISHWYIVSSIFGILAMVFLPIGFTLHFGVSNTSFIDKLAKFLTIFTFFTASIGILIAFLQLLQKQLLKSVVKSTAEITSMIFIILIGASLFSLVFKSLGGNDLIHLFLTSLPGGKIAAFITVMIFIFLLGFILDTIEITYVIIPMIAVPLISMGFNPVWLGVVIAVNLQTSFLTPPFGFALFYLRRVAPKSIKTTDIYKGVIPFILIQIIVLILITLFPSLVTFLPKVTS